MAISKKRKITLVILTSGIVAYWIIAVVTYIIPFCASPAKNQPVEPFMHVSWYVSPDEVIKAAGKPGSSFEHRFKTLFLAYSEKTIFERTAKVSYHFEYNHLYECTWTFTDPLSDQAAIIQKTDTSLKEYGLNPIQVANPIENYRYYGDADTLVYVIKGPIINLDEIICVKVVLFYRHSEMGALHSSRLK